MSLPVRWRASARADLFALYDWIARQAGPEAAYDYTTAIEARTAELRSYPHIGAPRPDLAEGIRTIVHRRRTLIAYRVTADAVEIVALAHGGRDLGSRFDPESD